MTPDDITRPYRYIVGYHGPHHALREYRSADGLIGKVTRTRRAGEGWGRGVTRYYVWADPSVEYATEAQARAALGEE